MQTTPTQGVPVPQQQKKGFVNQLKALLSIFKRKPKGKEMDLGEKNKFVFDKVKNKWIIPGQPESEEEDVPPPPVTNIISKDENKKETKEEDKEKDKDKGKNENRKEKKKETKKGNGKKKKRPLYAALPGTQAEDNTDNKEEEEKANPSGEDQVNERAGRASRRDEAEEMVSEEAKTETKKELDTHDDKSEEGGNLTLSAKKPDTPASNSVRESTTEKVSVLEARNRELELMVDESEQKANEAEFLLREYIEEIENDSIQYEDQAKSFYSEKAVMTIKIKGLEDEARDLKEKLEASEKMLQGLRKEKETYAQMIFKDEGGDQLLKDGEPLASSSEDEDKGSDNKKLMEADDEIFQLKFKLKEYEKKLEEAEQAKIAKDDELTETRSAVQTLKSENELLTITCQKALDDANKLIEDESSKYEKLYQEIEEVKTQVRTRDDEIKKLKEEIGKNTESLQNAESQKKEELHKLKLDFESKLLEEIDRLKNEVTGKDDEITRLKEDKEDEIAKLKEDKDEEIENKDEEITKMKIDANGKDGEIIRLKGDIENRETEIQKLKESIENMDAEIKKTSMSSNTNSQEIEGLKEEIEKKENENKNLIKEFNEKKLELEKLKDQIKKIAEDGTSKDKTIKQLAEGNQTKDEEIEKLNEQLKQTISDNSTKEELMTLTEEHKKKIEQMQSQIDQFSAEKEERETTMKGLEAESASQKANIDKLERELAKSKNELEIAKAGITQMQETFENEKEELRKQIHAKTEQITAARKDVEEKEEELETHKKLYVDTENRSKELESIVKAKESGFQSEIQNSKAAITKLQNEKSDLVREKARLTSALEARRNEPADLRFNEQLVRQREYYEQQIISLYNSYNNVRAEQDLEGFRRLNDDIAKLQIESNDLRLQFGNKEQALELIGLRLKELNEYFGIPSDTLKESEDLVCSIYLNLERLEQHMKKMEQEIDNSQLAVNMAENKNYLLENSLMETRESLQRQKDIYEDGLKEVEYYKTLWQIQREQEQKSKSKYQELLTQHELLKTKLDEHKKQIDLMSQNILSEKDKHSKTAASLSACQQDLSKAKDENVKTIKELTILKQKFDDAEVAHRQENESKNKTIKSLEEIKTKLETDLTTQQNSYKSKTAHHEDAILKSKQEREVLEAEAKKTQQNLKDCQTQLANVKDKIGQITTERDDLKKKLQENENSAVQNIRQYKDQCDVLSAQIEDKDRQIESAKDAINKVAKLEKQLKEANENEEAMNKSLKDRESQFQQKINDYNKLMSNKNDLASKLEEAIETENELNKKIKEQGDNYQEAIKELEQIKSNSEGLEEEAKKVQTLEKQLEDAKQREIDIKQAIEDMQQDQTMTDYKTKEEIEELKKKAALFEVQLGEKTDKEATLQKELKEQKELLKQKSLECDKLADDNAKKNTAMKKLKDSEGLEAKISEYQKKEQSFTQELKVAKAQEQKKIDECKTLQGNYDSLNKKMEEITKSFSDELVKLKKENKELMLKETARKENEVKLQQALAIINNNKDEAEALFQKLNSGDSQFEETYTKYKETPTTFLISVIESMQDQIKSLNTQILESRETAKVQVVNEVRQEDNEPVIEHSAKRVSARDREDEDAQDTQIAQTAQVIQPAQPVQTAQTAQSAQNIQVEVEEQKDKFVEVQKSEVPIEDQKSAEETNGAEHAQEEGSGISSWIASFFLTEKDTESISRKSPKKK